MSDLNFNVGSDNTSLEYLIKNTVLRTVMTTVRGLWSRQVPPPHLRPHIVLCDSLVSSGQQYTSRSYLRNLIVFVLRLGHLQGIELRPLKLNMIDFCDPSVVRQ